MQPSGNIRHTVDLTQPAWERISLYDENWEPLDLDRVFFVAANNHTTDSRSPFGPTGRADYEAPARARMLALPQAQMLGDRRGEAGMPVVHTRDAQRVLFVENHAGHLIDTITNSEGATGVYIEFVRSVLRDDIANRNTVGNFETLRDRFYESGPNWYFLMPVMDPFVIGKATNIVNANIGIDISGTNAATMTNVRARLNPQVTALWDLYVEHMNLEQGENPSGPWNAFLAAMEEAGEVILASGHIDALVSVEADAQAAYTALGAALANLIIDGNLPTPVEPVPLPDVVPPAAPEASRVQLRFVIGNSMFTENGLPRPVVDGLAPFIDMGRSNQDGSNCKRIYSLKT
jgi:hypothetical protein